MVFCERSGANVTVDVSLASVEAGGGPPAQQGLLDTVVRRFHGLVDRLRRDVPYQHQTSAQVIRPQKTPLPDPINIFKRPIFCNATVVSSCVALLQQCIAYYLLSFQRHTAKLWERGNSLQRAYMPSRFFLRSTKRCTMTLQYNVSRGA